MKLGLLVVMIAAPCVSVSTLVHAGTPYVEELSCAVGGEKFSHTSTASYSSYGSRPDGKPFGSWIFPLPLPECPTNRLVMFRDFEENEIEQLTVLVASDEYKSLHEQTTYYRAQWLADRLPGRTEAPWLLMRAVWQTDEMGDVRRAYLEEFALRAAAVPLDTANIDSVYLRFLTANAYRELARFDDAGQILESIIPDRLPANEGRDWRWLYARISILDDVIRQNDSSIEPLRLIPEDIAISRCEEWIESGREGIDPYCHSSELRRKDEARQDAVAVADAAAADLEANMEASAEAANAADAIAAAAAAAAAAADEAMDDIER